MVPAPRPEARPDDAGSSGLRPRLHRLALVCLGNPLKFSSASGIIDVAPCTRHALAVSVVH